MLGVPGEKENDYARDLIAEVGGTLGPDIPGQRKNWARLQRIVAQEIEQHGEEQVRSQAKSLRSQWEYALTLL